MIAIDEKSLDYDLRKFLQYLRLELALADNSISAYMQDIISLRHFVKDKAMKDISHTDIISFMAYGKLKGLSIETTLRRLSGISQFFDYLLIEKVIKANPVEFIAKPKKWAKLPTFLNFDEVEKILNCNDNSTPKTMRDGLMINLLYASGVRVSELISIKVTDIDFKRGIIKVVGKGSKARIVPVYDELVKSIEDYLPIRHTYFVKSSDNGYLFLNRFGEHLTRQYVWEWVKEICKQAGIKKDISPHTLRHCFATHLLSGGADLRTIQIFLGHSNISTTEIYTHLADDDKRKTLINFHPRYR